MKMKMKTRKMKMKTKKMIILSLTKKKFQLDLKITPLICEALNKFENGSYRKFENINAFQFFLNLWLDMQNKFGGRAKIIQTIDSNYGIASKELVDYVRNAYQTHKEKIAAKNMYLVKLSFNKLVIIYRKVVWI